jgi:prepilin-type N-terminal cleavage/methylation domain-containing protein
MTRARLINGLKRFLSPAGSRRVAGFTLIELLVSILIGAIIAVSLLSLVVDLNRTNQLDTARTETQRDIQAAMNYISQELREAIFIYDGTCLQGLPFTAANFRQSCPGIVNHIPPGMSSTSQTNPITPILAFWRTDPLPAVLLERCRANSTTVGLPNSPVNGIPCVSGRTYTLVVYALVDDKNANDIWQGKGRLVRYQLSQFDSDGRPTSGYVDPLGVSDATFFQWPYTLQTNNGEVNLINRQTAAGGRPTGATIEDLAAVAPVLTDFIDDGQNPTGAPNRGALTPLCPNVPTGNAADPNSFYALSPRADAPFRNPTAGNALTTYICVRGSTMTNPAIENRVNQEVVLVMTGNLENRVGVQNTIPSNAADFNERYRDRFLFTQQTRVLSRGILDKNLPSN